MHPKLDPRLIDKLVDDELSPSERRELLGLIDTHPEGWRTLGLAFLEAQAWRSEASGLTRELAQAPAERVAAVPSSTTRKRRLRLTLVASLLGMAFAAGFVSGGGLMAGTDGSPGQVVQVPKPTESDPSPEGGAGTIEQEVQTVGHIELTTATSGEFPAGEVPLMSGIALDPNWMAGQSSSVPEHLRLRWERRGYRLEEEHSVMSVGLSDGRRAVVPVENVRLKYVGHQIY